MAKSYPSVYDTDLYRILQVHSKASPEVIDAAHKALLKMFAPRKIGDDEKEAVKIGEAYTILSHASDRRNYDEYRNRERKMIGPYRILSKIAQGGFGTTYKAEHVENGRISCIKHCSEVSLQAETILKAETNTIWDLRHYGLPVMKDLIKLEDGSYALVMSWIEGPTLAQEIEKRGRLDSEDVAWRTERILNTFMYLHDHGIIHGDIKPQNIIVQPDHTVALVDFGLSLVKPSATSASVGYTDIFSPPEQLAGKPLVPESDFYSLGMTMIQALTGDYKLTSRKEVPANVPDALCDFIKSLIVRDVRNRPQSARVLFGKFPSIRQASFGRTGSSIKQASKL